MHGRFLACSHRGRAAVRSGDRRVRTGRGTASGPAAAILTVYLRFAGGLDGVIVGLRQNPRRRDER